MYQASVEHVSGLEQYCLANGEVVFEAANMTTMWREFLMDGTQANSPMEMLQSIASASLDDITSIRVYRMNAEQ